MVPKGALLKTYAAVLYGNVQRLKAIWGPQFDHCSFSAVEGWLLVEHSPSQGHFPYAQYRITCQYASTRLSTFRLHNSNEKNHSSA